MKRSNKYMKVTGVYKKLMHNAMLKSFIEESSEDQKMETKPIPKITKLKANITPGTILIILAGRFRGKKAVFLKQLESGLLLVNGPFTLSKVPLQRVNQNYVIVTSTKINIESINLSSDYNDSLFAREKKQKSKEFIKEDAMEIEKPALSKERIAMQKEIDSQLMPIIEGVPLLSEYIKSIFTLQRGQAPHRLKF